MPTRKRLRAEASGWGNIIEIPECVYNLARELGLTEPKPRILNYARPLIVPDAYVFYLRFATYELATLKSFERIVGRDKPVEVTVEKKHFGRIVPFARGRIAIDMNQVIESADVPAGVEERSYRRLLDTFAAYIVALDRYIHVDSKRAGTGWGYPAWGYTFPDYLIERQANGNVKMAIEAFKEDRRFERMVEEHKELMPPRKWPHQAEEFELRFRSLLQILLEDTELNPGEYKVTISPDALNATCRALVGGVSGERYEDGNFNAAKTFVSGRPSWDPNDRIRDVRLAKDEEEVTNLDKVEKANPEEYDKNGQRKRKRGRPRKEDKDDKTAEGKEEVPVAPKKRGRPPKVKKEEPTGVRVGSDHEQKDQNQTEENEGHTGSYVPPVSGAKYSSSDAQGRQTESEEESVSDRDTGEEENDDNFSRRRVLARWREYAIQKVDKADRDMVAEHFETWSSHLSDEDVMMITERVIEAQIRNVTG